MPKRISSGLFFTLLVSFLLMNTVLQAEDRPSAPDVEARTAELLKEPGVTIVHLWAAWCPNCQSELRSGGWAKFVAANKDTHFIFVTVWDDGKDGRAALEKSGIIAGPNVTILAHPGSRKGDDKLKSFLGLPVSWIPSTWIYSGGSLNYALNYGEMHFDILQRLVDDSRKDW